MELNSTDHCGCDNHGTCVQYNESYYEISELTLHKSWNKHGSLLNAQVCQCDPGWTGYGDLGVFQHEALLNCATSIIFIKAAWGVGILGSALIWVKAIEFMFTVFRKREDWKRLFFVRPTIRLIGSSCALYLTLYKSLFNKPDWERAISFSPVLRVLYSSLIFFGLYEAVETDIRQLRRFVAGTLQEFGLFAKHEQRRIKYTGTALKLYAATCGVLFAVLVSSTNEVLWSIGYAFGLSQSAVTFSVTALYIKPRTFQRLLNVLKNMVKEKESQRMSGDYDALQAEIDDQKQKLLSIQKNVSMQYRVPKYELTLGVLILVPFVFRENWKYLGYVATFWTVNSGVAGTFIMLAYLRNRSKMKVSGATTGKQVSTSVSAFQSSITPSTAVTRN